MIDCSVSACIVSMNEQVICSLIWGFKWMFIPTTALAIIYYLYMRYIHKEKTK